jgi:hypothetical protein
MYKKSIIFKSLILLVSLMVAEISYAQNVGINSTGAAPDASAGLDVNFTDKGMLIPRVALTGTTDVATIASPATSLMVYNTATVSDVTPGFYYYTGSSWARVASASDPVATPSTNAWSLTGNPAQTSTMTTGSYIGTTDSNPLRFRTNATQRMLVTAAGNVGIGTTADADVAASRLVVDAGGTMPTAVEVTGSINNYLEFNIQNTSNGNSASSDIVATADNGNSTSNYIDMGINSSSYTNNKSNILNKVNVAYLYSNANAALKIGNGGLGQRLVFFTNPSTGTLGTLTANGFERMKIDGDGNVGIGTFVEANGTDATISYKLTVDGIVAPRSNNDFSLGTSTNKWTTVYATNSTINTSDRRLKQNIANLEYGLKEVLALQPVRYNWKNPKDTANKIGLIAQDTRTVVPEVVYGDEAKEDLGMSYAELVPVLINAIKEQQKQIDELQKKVQALENK